MNQSVAGVLPKFRALRFSGVLTSPPGSVVVCEPEKASVVQYVASTA